MALATQCPSCETVFRISTMQAAAKSGMVRCGQCLHVFNSLDALVRVEDLEFVDEPEADELHDPLGEDDTSPDDFATEPLDDDLMSQFSPSLFAEIDPEDVADVVERDHEQPVVREWWVPEEGEVVMLTPAPSAEALAEAEALEAAAAEPALAAPLADQRLDLEWPKAGDGTGPEFMRALPKEKAPRSRAERVSLAILSAVAAIALAGQAVYYWRDEIAARIPDTRPLLTAACDALRCRVGYPTHLESITIESSNVQLGANSTTLYTLNALLRNRDSVDLRYPMLALTLTDTQDQPILRRVLRPEDYLPADRLRTGFAAESELPVRVMFELADVRFVGYRVDRFYPD